MGQRDRADVDGAYRFLDLVPKGRDEDGFSWSMEWVRRHDQLRKYHGTFFARNASSLRCGDFVWNLGDFCRAGEPCVSELETLRKLGT